MFCRSVFQSFSCSVVQSFSRSVVQSFSRSVVQSFSRSVVQSFSRSVVQSFSRSVVQSFSRSVGPSVRRSVGPSVRRSVGPSVRRSVGPSAVCWGVSRHFGDNYSTPRRFFITLVFSDDESRCSLYYLECACAFSERVRDSVTRRDVDLRVSNLRCLQDSLFPPGALASAYLAGFQILLSRHCPTISTLINVKRHLSTNWFTMLRRDAIKVVIIYIDCTQM